jgi:hypothetical protein
MGLAGRASAPNRAVLSACEAAWLKYAHEPAYTVVSAKHPLSAVEGAGNKKARIEVGKEEPPRARGKRGGDCNRKKKQKARKKQKCAAPA